MTTPVRQAPPRRLISDDKERLRNQFMPLYYRTETPCRHDPDTWHAESVVTRRHAATLCRERCPLVELCHRWAAADPPEREGVWGGRDWHRPKSRAERERIARTEKEA